MYTFTPTHNAGGVRRLGIHVTVVLKGAILSLEHEHASNAKDERHVSFNAFTTGSSMQLRTVSLFSTIFVHELAVELRDSGHPSRAGSKERGSEMERPFLLAEPRARYNAYARGIQ